MSFSKVGIASFLTFGTILEAAVESLVTIFACDLICDFDVILYSD